MPRIAELEALYQRGLQFRHGQVVMIAGRSGSQKSGLALWLVSQWGLPALYFSADMSPSTAAGRIASMSAGKTISEVEQALDMGGAMGQEIEDAIAEATSDITFSFDSPITWRQVDEELEAFVELHDAYPQVIVFDNLMDIDGAQSSYEVQMDVMSAVTEISRETGATVLIMHHASDKSWEAKTSPWTPPSREQIKGGLSEKPELSLSVALDPHSMQFKVAIIKQRTGWNDPSAGTYDCLRAVPEYTRFEKW